jgi:hypothetical protein
MKGPKKTSFYARRFSMGGKCGWEKNELLLVFALFSSSSSADEDEGLSSRAKLSE